MISKEDALSRISALVNRFEEQYQTFTNSSYKEAQVRIDFINPFFEALGWDVNNKKGKQLSYREVITEANLLVDESQRAPDYAFCQENGKPIFFLEAKKPNVGLWNSTYPAYQVRRYGWSASLDISIVTDFEEFAVYDCRTMPVSSDQASIERIKYITFKDYIKEFDYLWDNFSKENCSKETLSKLVVKTGKTKGTDSVDKEFLKSLDRWRTLIAEDIVAQNPNLDVDEINFAVQQTIDRIIFLRIAEDRSVEIYGTLKKCLPDKSAVIPAEAGIQKNTIYKKLFDVFREADIKYNSGLFDFKKDTICSKISISDVVLETIIGELYYPKCPYEFSVLAVEILGSAYEQFLGKTITIDEFHRAKIEEKPEVRKAGGVYYTPQYIVEYIVQNTVGKIVEKETPEEVSKIKICDPACGSGSFLIGAYQYLLDWHKDYYTKQGKSKALQPDGNLTTAEKKRILLNNIYGVDLDVNAVEVTKLSLLLKCMEGETEASINQQIKIFKERVLPTLDDNIKCGNSLIDIDFYDSQIDFEPGMEKKVKPFNWESAFPSVFGDGGLGFDVVIGNPPYIKIQTMIEYMPNQVIEYYKTRFIAGKGGNIDIYVVFIEKAYNLLNKNGLMGFIQPHKFFQSDFGFSIRNYLAEKKAVDRIIHFGANQIFSNATTYTCLLFLNKLGKNDFDFLQVQDPIEWNMNQSNYHTFKIKQPLKDMKWNFTDNKKQSLLDKLNSMPLKLKDITRKIFVGLQTSADKIYVLRIIKENKETYTCYSNSLEKEIEIEKGLVKPFLMGKDVKRYENMIPKNVVIFPYHIKENKAILMDKEFISSNFSLGWKYILENKKELEEREKGKMKVEGFYAYIYPKNLVEFDSKKIILPDITSKPEFTFDPIFLYFTTTVYGIKFNNNAVFHDYYYLALLNSKLNWLFVSSTGTILRGGYTRFHKQYVENFPIPEPPSPSTEAEIVRLVETILQLNKDLQKATLQQQKEQLQQRIAYTDKKIDQLVYQLYGLTEEEIKIMEG